MDELATTGSTRGRDATALLVPRPPCDLEDRELVRRRVVGRLLGGTPAPILVGRFTLLEQVGRGGMGIVYAAYDPQLDRKVALKVVDDRRFGDDDDGARRRLELEARSAAHLAHPNVITIYDVGVHEGRVFLAMEFVQGTTLSGWSRQHPRTWREVVAMFLQIGRGLAAAHAAGLVHRDFKPDNVLIGEDGRPRVADFGLAQSMPGSRATHDGLAADDDGLAQTPAMAGTPAYMAPEQFDGVEVGPAADQFAFCVSLFEALFGVRPFRGRSIDALAAEVRRGRVELPSVRPAVPRSLVALIVRGLAPDVRQRHASIDALLAALGRRLHARRRRLLVGLATGLVGTALAAGFGAAGAVTPEPCDDMDDPRVWSPSHAADLRAALTRGNNADPESIVLALDEYTRAWSQVRREVCEATRVEGTQSDLALQLRMACLDRIGGRIVGFSDEITAGGDSSRIRGTTAAERLPPLDSCDDIEHLARLSNRFADRSRRASAEQDRAWTRAVELVERALTRRLLGRDDAREPAERAIAMAEANDLPGVHSRALALLAEIEFDDGHVERAEEMRRDAVRFAVASGNDDAAIQLMLDQVDAAVAAERVTEADLHLGYFDAFLRRFAYGPGYAQLMRRAAIVRGRLALLRGDAEQAQSLLRAALADPDLGDADRRPALMASGTALRMLGRPQEALATWTVLLDLYDAGHGDRASVLNNIAVAQLDLGELVAAREALDGAERIVLDRFGGAHPLLAAITTNQGWLARLAGDPARAREHLERALALGTTALGPRHPSLAFALDQLGEVEREANHLDLALDHFARAGTLRDAGLGPDHPETATTLTGMAKVFTSRGEHGRAAEALAAAARVRARHR